MIQLIRFPKASKKFCWVRALPSPYHQPISFSKNTDGCQERCWAPRHPWCKWSLNATLKRQMKKSFKSSRVMIRWQGKNCLCGGPFLSDRRQSEWECPNTAPDCFIAESVYPDAGRPLPQAGVYPGCSFSHPNG